MRLITTALAAMTMSAGSLSAADASMSLGTTHQPIDGFGACSAWYVDELMYDPDREALLDLLFKRDGGAGLSILRHRIPPQPSSYVDYAMNLTSGDLDLGVKSTIGMRFTGLAIPAGASISEARIQFTAKGDYSDASAVVISGEASDDAATFSDTAGDAHNRPRTSATVAWTIANWNSGGSGSEERTPDIAPIVQEIVDRAGWASGNDIVIFIANRTGRRSAHSYDNQPADAPVLTVTLGDGNTVSAQVSASSDDIEESGISHMALTAQVTQEAFERDCQIVWGSSWSPPYEYKDNNSTNNGTLERTHYQDFADHLEFFRAEHDRLSGIPLYALSPQNEPGKKPWESCVWSSTDYRDFIRDHLGPTLDPDCLIIGPEETVWSDVPGFYQPTHDDPEARAHLDILAGHCYGNSNPSQSHNQFGKPVWETEWSYDTSNDDLSIDNGVKWAENFWELLVNAEVQSAHHWWMVNFKDDGRQQGLINSVPGVAAYTVPKRLWTIGNYSKFVRPGWVRVDITKEPANELRCAAFTDPTSGAFAIVVINDSGSTQTLDVTFSDFTAGSVVPHRTSASEDLAQLAPITAGTGFTASIPHHTVTTFVGSTVVDDEPPAAPSNLQAAPNP